jgi:oxygen-independent coproporphyrinogen-3 oxidase
MVSVAARTKVLVAMSFLDPVRSLYVHVPFCAHKCEYCAFYSETSKGEIVNRYVGALIRELELVADSLQPRTIFFGGGTPSLLTLAQWERVFDAMDRLHLSGAAEWTVECNPATVSEDKARLLRNRGVNRISMGVQSLDEALLDRLGRIHSRDMVFRSFDILRRVGFDNVNVDLMFAIPGQTMETWRSTLREATALGSEHLSCYEVIYEEDTPLFEQLKAGQFDVDEELAANMYEELLDFSAAKGFHQYEIANFAQNPVPASAPDDPMFADVPSRACRHNVTYWRGGSCHGLGPAASGYVGGSRSKNWSNTTLYCEQLEKGKRAVEFSETLSPAGRTGELAAFGLRMAAGWPLELFRRTTGADLAAEWREPIERLVGLGYAELTPERFHLTRQGLRYADWAAELFLRT